MQSIPSPPFKHKQVEIGIRQLAQTLPIGARLPAERSLAAFYHCNFLTVRRAFKELVDDGIVVRRMGSGTFVARHTLPSHRTANRIGILVAQEAGAHSHRLLQAIARAGLNQKMELRSGWVRDFHNDGLRQAQVMEKEGCSAILIPWFPRERMAEIRAFVRNSPLPVSLPITIRDSETADPGQHDVLDENRPVSVGVLCDYFHALGHRRIALLGPDSTTDAAFGQALGAYTRHRAFQNAANFCGLVSADAQAMDQLAERWKAYRGDFAVISHDDKHALRFMTSMHKIGLSAPVDFQIVGCNDTEAGGYSDPPLSTLRQDFDLIGHRLLTNALARARGEVRPPARPPRPQLLVRESCGGRGKLNDVLRTQLPALALITDQTESALVIDTPTLSP